MSCHKFSRFTIQHYLDLLRGSASSKIKQSGHHILPLYNAGSAYSRTDLERLMHLLITQDYLSEDIQIGNHDNAVSYVILGTLGQDLLRGVAGRIKFHIKIGSSATAKSKQPMGILLDPILDECYNSLLALRRVIAKEKKLSVEALFTTAALQEMAQQLPTTKEAFLKITGVTENKWHASSGERFLKFLKHFMRQKSMNSTNPKYNDFLTNTNHSNDKVDSYNTSAKRYPSFANPASKKFKSGKR